MGELIRKKFESLGDFEMARSLAFRSSGVHRTELLAKAFAEVPRSSFKSFRRAWPRLGW